MTWLLMVRLEDRLAISQLRRSIIKEGEIDGRRSAAHLDANISPSLGRATPVIDPRVASGINVQTRQRGKYII
jgi:hypothetical protein